MKKIDLGQAVTILANIGVIAGIVFLAIELRLNTQAVRSEAGQGLQDQIQAVVEYMDDEIWGLLLKAGTDPASLSEVEIASLNSFYIMQFLAHQNTYFHVLNGTIPANRVEGWWQNLRNMLEPPLGKAGWEQHSYLLADEFRQFVAEEVMTLEPTGDKYFVLPVE